MIGVAFTSHIRSRGETKRLDIPLATISWAQSQTLIAFDFALQLSATTDANQVTRLRVLLVIIHRVK